MFSARYRRVEAALPTTPVAPWYRAMLNILRETVAGLISRTTRLCGEELTVRSRRTIGAPSNSPCARGRHRCPVRHVFGAGCLASRDKARLTAWMVPEGEWRDIRFKARSNDHDHGRLIVDAPGSDDHPRPGLPYSSDTVNVDDGRRPGRVTRVPAGVDGRSTGPRGRSGSGDGRGCSWTTPRRSSSTV